MTSSSLPKPTAGSTSVRMGAAFLRPSKERDHYELMRPIITVKNEGDRLETEQHPEPIGPLAVYRRKRKGDRMDPSQQSPSGPPLEMRTMDTNGRPVELVLCWWVGMESDA